jgi:DNA topoisomerase III
VARCACSSRESRPQRKPIADELWVTGESDGFISCGDDTITRCFGHLLEQAEPDK